MLDIHRRGGHYKLYIQKHSPEERKEQLLQWKV